MKTLGQPAVVEELSERLGRLKADQRPLWGKMNAGQMVRHLLDSFALAMGQTTARQASSWAQRNVIRHLALRAPMKWPPGVPTRPEFDQMIGGTKPGEFTADVAQLQAVLQRFAAQPRDFRFGTHPTFLELSEWEWMRWAWLHTDHHLRQFGL